MEKDPVQIVEKKKSPILTLSKQSNFHYLVLIIVGLATRLDLLFRPYPLSFDDGVYAMSIKHIANGAKPFTDVFSSQGPYFLPLISIPAQIFGFSPWSARLVPFIAGILGIIFTYRIAIRFMSHEWALLSSSLVAFSGIFLRATTPITSDGILATIVLGCVLLTYRFIDKANFLNAVYLGLLVGVGCGIKNVFMIPVLIFIIIATWNTKFILRLVAGTVSVGTFLIPFFIFGFNDTFNQSILYHLGKDESLDLKSNISKISTTFSSFDLVLLIFCIVALFIFLRYLMQSFKSGKITFAYIKMKLFKSDKPYLFILVLGIGTTFLITIQAPLFRNHLAAVIAPLAISSVWIISRYMDTTNFDLSKTYTKVIMILIALVTASMFASGIYSTYVDAHIRGTSQLKGAIRVLNNIDDECLILTNNPGLAFASSLDVPLGLEDTSRFRFLTKNKDLKISIQNLEDTLDDNERICAFVTAPLPITQEVKLNNIAPNDWELIYDDGYMIWLRPNN